MSGSGGYPEGPCTSPDGRPDVIARVHVLAAHALGSPDDQGGVEALGHGGSSGLQPAPW